MYLVIDVGGTFIKYAIMDRDGVIIEKGKTKTSLHKTDGVDEFIEHICEIYDNFKLDYILEGIAMDLPGQIDVENGIVYGGGALSYLDNVHLADILSEKCDSIRVSLENDGKAAALAEVWKGAAKDYDNACVMLCGTGFGGGVVINKRIHHGNNMIAGELSYVFGNMTRNQVDNLIPMIDCKNVKEMVEKHPYYINTDCSVTGLLLKVATKKGIELDGIDGEKVYCLAKEGDQICIDALEDMYFGIAKAALSIKAIVDPDIILVGGGISAEPLFLEGIKRYVNKLKVVSPIYDSIRIEVCEYRNASNLLGSLYNFIQKYEED